MSGLPGLQLYEKVTPTQMFSFAYCEVFKSTFFHITPPVGTLVFPEITWEPPGFSC